MYNTKLFPKKNKLYLKTCLPVCKFGANYFDTSCFCTSTILVLCVCVCVCVCACVHVCLDCSSLFSCRCVQLPSSGHYASCSCCHVGCSSGSHSPQPTCTWSSCTHRRPRYVHTHTHTHTRFTQLSYIFYNWLTLLCICEALLGIQDLSRPEYGDPVKVQPGDVTMFWACGVTAIEAILSSSEQYDWLILCSLDDLLRDCKVSRS